MKNDTHLKFLIFQLSNVRELETIKYAYAPGSFNRASIFLGKTRQSDFPEYTPLQNSYKLGYIQPKNLYFNSRTWYLTSVYVFMYNQHEIWQN